MPFFVVNVDLRQCILRRDLYSKSVSDKTYCETVVLFKSRRNLNKTFHHILPHA